MIHYYWYTAEAVHGGGCIAIVVSILYNTIVKYIIVYTNIIMV